MLKKIVVLLFLLICLIGCTQSNKEELIIYTSVDQNISEQILVDFEAESGISVKAVYDIEASKTTGLANRLIAEKDNPQADVFWNSEIMMTINLKEADVFQPYISKQSQPIPSSYKDAEGYWTGFGGRARVMIINTDLVKLHEPSSILDLINDDYKHYKKAIAYPMFGTSLTHLYIMNQLWGEEKTLEFFLEAQENNTLIVDGNSVVRDLVVSGVAAFGITDTDDAFVAMKKNDYIKVLYLDQVSSGTLVIPNTVGLIKDCNNPEPAKAFIDYLLRKETEEKLMSLGFIDVSLTDVNQSVVFLECDFETAYKNSNDLIHRIKEMLVR
jgi:iron(III) transport system substrate-binding protein